MLNDQEFSKSEVIIFENLKSAAKKINDLEDLGHLIFSMDQKNPNFKNPKF